MRKFVKKVAALATTVAMVAAMGISAFADSYTFVGNVHLFNETDEDSKTIGWIPTATDQILTDAGNGMYTGTFTCNETGDWEAKLLKDADVFGWAFQCCLGNPANTWGDNQTQFRFTVEAGEYTVVAKPENGFLTIVQNGKSVNTVVRYKSRDEDADEFVEPTVTAISACKAKDSGANYEPAAFEADYATFLADAVALVGPAATEETTAAAEETTAATEETTAATEETTAATEETTAAATQETTAVGTATTAQKPAPTTGDVAPVAVMVSLLAAVAVVVAVAKKKEA